MNIASLFNIDSLSFVIWGLVVLMGSVVGLFSYRYLHGDPMQGAFYRRVLALSFLSMVLVSADHIGLFTLSWMLMGIVLTRMIDHSPNWLASRYAGRMALAYFLVSGFGLGIGLLGISAYSGSMLFSEMSLSSELSGHIGIWVFFSFILISAMIQSGLFPFHRWLFSSLNGPTPVSAFMHAGVINAGGVLLCRIVMIFEAVPSLYIVVYGMGILNAFLGAFWMLTQSDIKRSLVSSTMAQMGFMMIQIGLGLFSVAILHSVLHGAYKAFQFLNSGSSVAIPELANSGETASWFRRGIYMILSAIILGVVISLGTGKSVLLGDGGSILVVFAIFAGGVAGFGASRLRENRRVWHLGVFALALVAMGGTYSGLFYLSELVLGLNQSLVLSPFHWGLTGLYFVGIIGVYLAQSYGNAWVYIRSLNGAKASSQTVSASRRGIRFE